MKQIVCLVLMVLVATDAFAQRGGSGGGARGGGSHGGFVGGGSRPGAFRGHGVRRFDGHFGPGFTGGFYPYPLFDDWYDQGAPYEPQYPVPPSTVVVQAAPPVIVQQAPPPPAVLVIHNYVGAPAPQGGEQPTFVIALNDGSRLEATAVWVQDGILHYIDVDNQGHQIPLTSVDRNLTRKLNEERNLNLRLPPP